MILFSHRVTGWALRRAFDGLLLPVNIMGHRPQLFGTKEAALENAVQGYDEPIFVVYTETLEPGSETP